MRKIVIALLIMASLQACNDILDKTDLTGVDERVWDDESTANLFINRIYDLAMPVFPSMRSATTLPTAIHTISDESNTGDNKILYGTVTIDQVTDFYGNNSNNAWVYIRKVNILLDGIDNGVLADDVKNKIKGQAYFLRAWVYFNMVKVYGGVPIITTPQNWDTEDLYVTRAKTSECFDFIVSDLDKAIELLQPGIPANQGSGDRGRVTKDVALAVKGRVLLFWASPQFNPSNDAARWEQAYEANKDAYDILTADGCALFPNFANLFTDEGSANREAIFIRSYDGASRANTFENGARSYSESSNGGGTFQPTWDLVKSFPMADGTPSMVNNVPANGFDSVYYWVGRDPRFAATIVWNGATWELSGRTGRKQWNYVGITEDKSKQTTTGFYCKKFVNTKTLAANATLGTTDWVELRFAEVMLNLAECANATDRSSEAYDMLDAIRERAGIEDDNGHHGLDPAMDKDAMFKAIMDERRIEFAFEGKRHDDLRRNRLFHELNGRRRYGLLINIKAPYKVSDLEKKDEFGVMLREKLDLSGADYTTYFAPTYTNLDPQFPILFRDSYYFYGIPSTNMQRNTSLLQTKGWELSGSQFFDPLSE